MPSFQVGACAGNASLPYLALGLTFHAAFVPKLVNCQSRHSFPFCPPG
jgi:hypothetical protein